MAPGLISPFLTRPEGLLLVKTDLPTEPNHTSPTRLPRNPSLQILHQIPQFMSLKILCKWTELLPCASAFIGSLCSCNNAYYHSSWSTEGRPCATCFSWETGLEIPGDLATGIFPIEKKEGCKQGRPTSEIRHSAHNVLSTWSHRGVRARWTRQGTQQEMLKTTTTTKPLGPDLEKSSAGLHKSLVMWRGWSVSLSTKDKVHTWNAGCSSKPEKRKVNIDLFHLETKKHCFLSRINEVLEYFKSLLVHPCWNSGFRTPFASELVTEGSAARWSCLMHLTAHTHGTQIQLDSRKSDY